MKKIEYKLYFVPNTSSDIKTSEVQFILTTSLNKLGAEGWEMCGMDTDPVGTTYYFKREVEPERIVLDINDNEILY